MEFKDNLICARKERGLSQEALAAEVGVSRQAVSKWETGEAMPDLAKLIALSGTLGISIDELCGTSVPLKQAEPAVLEPPKAPLARYIALALCAVVLLTLGFFAGTRFAEHDEPENATENSSSDLVSPLPATIEVSGLEFGGDENGLQYYFVPSVVGEEYTYTLTAVSQTEQKTTTFPIECEGGACTGILGLPMGSYAVSLLISNGEESRSVPLTTGVTFNATGSRWTPIE